MICKYMHSTYVTLLTALSSSIAMHASAIAGKKQQLAWHFYSATMVVGPAPLSPSAVQAPPSPDLPLVVGPAPLSPSAVQAPPSPNLPLVVGHALISMSPSAVAIADTEHKMSLCDWILASLYIIVLVYGT